MLFKEYIDCLHLWDPRCTSGTNILHIITFANVVGRMLCIHPCLSVCLSVCLFVCLSVCLFVCLSVCLFVCLSVCLLAGLLKKLLTDLNKIFREGSQLPKDHSIKFW